MTKMKFVPRLIFLEDKFFLNWFSALKMTFDIYNLANFGGAIDNFGKKYEAKLRFSFD